MKIFDPDSPLLKSVDFVIRSTGGPPSHVIRNGGQETLNVSWFPALPNGVLAYLEDEGIWEEIGEPCEDENLMVRVADDGQFQVGPGDDDSVWISTSLKAGDELVEFMDFYVSARAEKIGSSSCSPKPLSQFIEEVFLLISQVEGPPRLFPLRGQQFAKQFPEATKMVDAWLSADWDTIISFGGHEHFGRWLEENAQPESLLHGTEELHLGDLILTGHGSVHFAGMLMADAESNLGHAPALVLRPSMETSRMWLIDFLDHATEADGLVERICKGWKHLPKGLDRITVAIPSTKRDQIASTIERRSARSAYLGYLRSAMQVREPFDQISPIYKKRTQAARCLHTELLDELVALQDPLPFFLEYPFRLFRREDDHVRKVRAGQRLLGLLAKVPLYLVIEELLSSRHPLGKSLLERVTEKPQSDGSLASLQAEIAESLKNKKACPLVAFQSLLSFLGDNESLKKIVEARNRMHHEPYDEVGFIKEVSERAPAIMDRLRVALKGCRVIVPIHTKTVSGKKTVTAEDACSTDAQFRIVELTVTLPLETFPSGELIVYREVPERVLVLGHLLVAKLVTHQSRDFGVFDRMEKNGPHFTYLRSE